MGETSKGQEFRNTHGHDTRYVLLYCDTMQQSWFWDNNTMDFVQDRSKATRMLWEDLERIGRIAQRYTPHYLIIEATGLIH